MFRDRANAHRSIRRNEKKIKELVNNIDDERKQGENYKADVSDKKLSTVLCVMTVIMHVG